MIPRCRPAARPVDGPERLAGVLDEAEAALLGERLEGRDLGRVAEDVHRQETRGRLADRCLGGSGVDVERDRVDVAEDRLHVLEEQAVRRRDEAQRGGDDLVAGAQPSARTARWSAACRSRRPRRPQLRPRPRSPARSAAHRPEREPAGPQDLENELLLALANVGPRERDRVSHWRGQVPGLCFLERVLERVDERLPARLDDVLRDADRSPGLMAVGRIDQDPRDRARCPCARR